MGHVREGGIMDVSNGSRNTTVRQPLVSGPAWPGGYFVPADFISVRPWRAFRRLVVFVGILRASRTLNDAPRRPKKVPRRHKETPTRRIQDAPKTPPRRPRSVRNSVEKFSPGVSR